MAFFAGDLLIEIRAFPVEFGLKIQSEKQQIQTLRLALPVHFEPKVL